MQMMSLTDALKEAFPLEAIGDPTWMRRNRPELFVNCRDGAINWDRWHSYGDESGRCAFGMVDRWEDIAPRPACDVVLTCEASGWAAS